jgi:hypothetical protein
MRPDVHTWQPHHSPCTNTTSSTLPSLPPQAFEPANLGPGKRVLVQSGAGGVGHMGVQIAKARGCYVVAVCGPKNVEFVKSELGADEVVDYSSQDFSEIYKDQPFDVVLDLMGGGGAARLPACLGVVLGMKGCVPSCCLSPSGRTQASRFHPQTSITWRAGSAAVSTAAALQLASQALSHRAMLAYPRHRFCPRAPANSSCLSLLPCQTHSTLPPSPSPSPRPFYSGHRGQVLQAPEEGRLLCPRAQHRHGQRAHEQVC